MRILLIGMGGVNAAFRNWTEPSLARALVQRGHSVYSYSYLDTHSPLQRLAHETIEGVEVARVKPGPLGFSWQLWQAMRRDQLPDIVHIHHLRNEFAWQAAIYFRRRGVPVVLSPIGLLHDRFISRDRDDPFGQALMRDNLIFDARGFASHLRREFRPRKHLRNWLTHMPLRMADHFVALSEFEKGLLEEFGISTDKVSVIPFAVDLKLVDEALVDGKPPHGFEYPRPRVLFIGQLKYRKGFDLLIRAAPQIRARFPTASFIFLTHNLSQREAFERLVDEVGGRQYIFLLEQKGESDTESEKMRQLAASDVFVFPTRYEGFGIPLLEAMACRVPIISTRIPVIDEIIQHGETGLLSRRNDADDLARQISCLLADATLRRRLVANARQRVDDNYTESLLAERTEEAYALALGRMRRG